eukprot:Colp12_sorted_trinity150504_noHs@21235
MAHRTPELHHDVVELRSTIATQAENIIQNILPVKIAQLTALKDEDIFSLKHLPKMSAALSIPFPEEEHNHVAKKRKRTTSEDHEEHPHTPHRQLHVATNAHIAKLVEALRGYILELIELCNTVKLWIQLNIPRIEDGNNFGVSVQVSPFFP